MNNVCFCLLEISGSSYSQIYATLRTSLLINEYSEKNIIEESKRRDDLRKAPRFTAWPKDFRVFSLTDDELKKVAGSASTSPIAESRPDSPSDSSQDEKRCQKPVTTDKTSHGSCSNANSLSTCDAKHEEIKCYYVDEEITEEECHKRCLNTGKVNGLQAQQGYCEENQCYCSYLNNGSCKRSKLSNFEKHMPKRSRIELDTPLASTIRITADSFSAFCR
ncbi:hypothetical protein QAD02_022389 [Eretmocerus hayati]|uniref:Uncharacterized protein n=1 Tax=Eretmocerus hayati TaxID=131215 RepID=A0ACC2PXR9_9HYME|nr:hypothetical protein QAD02_022389 [Eretmocerus hayati]